MTELREAIRSAMVDLDGVPQHIRRGRTLAVAEHPIVVDNPDLWRPVEIDYDTPTETATVEEDGSSGEPLARPPLNARRAVWEDYARSIGVDDAYLEGATKDELIGECDARE